MKLGKTRCCCIVMRLDEFSEGWTRSPRGRWVAPARISCNPYYFNPQNKDPRLVACTHKSTFCKRGSVNVRFAPKATEVLCCRELTDVPTSKIPLNPFQPSPACCPPSSW